MLRLKLSMQAMKPACGPPAPIGMPKRCAQPTTMSAPISPGVFSSVSASRSLAMMTAAFLAWILSDSALQSISQPLLAGYWISAAK